MGSPPFSSSPASGTDHETVVLRRDGHSRIVLSKALTSSYMVITSSRLSVAGLESGSHSPNLASLQHIRHYATQHLGRLVLNAPETNRWTLQLLTTQLYDPSPDVAELAVHLLEDACDELDALELVVAMRPHLDHLGEVGHPLLLR